MKTRSFPYLAALLAALIMLSVLWRFDHSRRVQYQQAVRITAMEELDRIASRFSAAINWRFSLGRTVASSLSIFPDMTEKEFVQLVNDVQRKRNDGVVQWICVIRNQKVSYSCSLAAKGPEKGASLEADPRFAEAAALAVRKGDLVIWHPPSENNDAYCVAISPIISTMPAQDGRPRRGELWGYVATRIRMLPLLREVGVIRQGNTLEFAIRTSHESTSQPVKGFESLYGDPDIFDANPLVATLGLRSIDTWQMGGLPVNGWAQVPPGTTRFWMIGFALTFAMALLAWFLARIPAQLTRAVRKATADLRVSEERFRSLFEATFEAVFVNDRGIILDANHAFEQTFGYSVAEIIGKSGFELVEESYRALVREANESHDEMPFEVRMVRRDGSSFDAEVVGKDHIYRGSVVRVVAVRDITERKRAEDRLRQRIEFEAMINLISTYFINLPASRIAEGIEKTLETLGQQTGVDSCFLVCFAPSLRKSHVVYEWNASGTEGPMGGLTYLFSEQIPWIIQQLEQSGFVHIPNVNDLPDAADAEKKILMNRRTNSMICLAVRRESTLIGMLGFELHRITNALQPEQLAEYRIVAEMLAGALERKRADEALRASMSNLDSANRLLQQYSANLKTMVEERTRELEMEREKALQASHAKSDFLSTMSHELRTPLNSILGLAQVIMMKMGPILPLQQKENLAAIITSGRRLLELINQLLDLSKIEAGRVDVKAAHFTIDLPLVEAFEAVRPLAERKGLEYRLRNQARGVHVRSDNDKLVQILINLLGNAVKFTEEGEIELTVRENGDGILFSVSDTGIGISPEEQAVIFQPFHQVDSSSTRRHGGSGLGLSISGRLAELLGGKLNVNSAKGQGSVFELWIPKNLNAPEVPALKASPKPSSLAPH